MQMVWELGNGKTAIRVKSMGAEMVSLRDIEKGRELLWQGDPDYWTGQAPVLFPIIGSLEDGYYLYEGRQYKLPRHGFARRKEFRLAALEEDRIELVLPSSEETRQVYPFDFNLHVSYRLLDKGVETAYKVVNNTPGPIYFSIGGHPAFNADVAGGNAVLAADARVDLSSYKMDVDLGLLMKSKFPVFIDEERVVMDLSWFRNDTLIFDSGDLQAMSLVDKRTRETVRVAFKGYPYLGVWTPNAPFLCIEPWHGVTDFAGGSHKLEEKAGIVKLEEGSSFSCAYSIAYSG